MNVHVQNPSSWRKLRYEIWVRTKGDHIWRKVRDATLPCVHWIAYETLPEEAVKVVTDRKAIVEVTPLEQPSHI